MELMGILSPAFGKEDKGGHSYALLVSAVFQVPLTQTVNTLEQCILEKYVLNYFTVILYS